MIFMTVDMDRINEELTKVVDPELGMSIMEVNLVDTIDVKEDVGEVSLEFHLTSPMCPPPFALKIASDIKNGLLSVDGVKSVKLNLKQHYMAEYINTTINDGK